MVKAFTILEMIINMAIMGIIIAMVYMIYVLFSSNVGGYTHFSTQYNNVQSFHNQLQNEFLECDKVLTRTDGGFSIVFYDETKIEYLKKKQWLYRQKDRLLDSIPLKELDIMLLSETPHGEKIVKTNFHNNLFAGKTGLHFCIQTILFQLYTRIEMSISIGKGNIKKGPNKKRWRLNQKGISL